MLGIHHANFDIQGVKKKMAAKIAQIEYHWLEKVYRQNVK